MGENTKIEWAHHTFNPWIGCTRLIPACDHCYAEAHARRYGHGDLWEGERRRTSESNWRQPIAWNRKAGERGVRPRVFCASLDDVFDNHIDPSWRSDLFGLIEDTPNLDWLLLTKRPQNVGKMLWPKWDCGVPSNIWIGTTVENQAEADKRREAFRLIPATTKFVSYEPALGPVDWHGWEFVKQIIFGGESGPQARVWHPNWARATRDYCARFGIAYLHKQNGEWIDADEWLAGIASNGAVAIGGIDLQPPPRPLNFEQAAHLAKSCGLRFEHQADGSTMLRVGKTRAGRLLDGRAHDEYPTVERN